MTVSSALYPSSNGYAIALGKNANTYNWECVDNGSGDTEYVLSIVDNRTYYDYYNFDDIGVANIIATQVTVYARMKYSGENGVVNGYIILRIGSTNYTLKTQALTTTWTTYSASKISGSWSQSDIDAMQIGVGLQCTYFEEDKYVLRSDSLCSLMYATVTYTLIAVPIGGSSMVSKLIGAGLL